MTLFRYCLAAFAFLLLARGVPGQEPRRPNFIVILTDDQGYGDVGVYGSPNIRTPNLDRMAVEGIRFTSFYAAPFCGPSRAALMTGSYPPRTRLDFNHGPGARTGIHPNEITIAELLKRQDYATMIVGKWHLGDAPEFLPARHGFDAWFGLPYSNDMWPYHPRMPPRPDEDERMKAARARAESTGFAGQGSYYPEGGGFPQPLPLMSNEEVVELNPDQTRLTALYTEKALEFISRNRDRPFFLYLPHSMPHVPLFPSYRFKGTSRRGLYGDVIEEIDAGVGRILARLEELNLDEHTLVVFTSDNGPWLEYGIDGGSAGPLRAGKSTPYEGGVRVPCIMRWPGRIPAGQVSAEAAANMDLLPTLARLAGTRALIDRVIDGADIWPIMAGEKGAKSPHEDFYYFMGRTAPGEPNLKAIRSGDWKLHLEADGDGVRGIELYDLAGDVGESRNLLDREREIVERLERKAQGFLEGLTKNSRPLGRLTRVR